MIKPLFGRREPVERPYEDLYNFKRMGIPTPLRVETHTAKPVWKYEQVGQSCTGFSVATVQTINNLRHLGSRPINRWRKYDGLWQYEQACLADGDPATSLQADIGSFLWASLWVAQHLGLRRLMESEPRPEEGIDRYDWCTGANVIDQLRAGFSLGRRVVVGTIWEQAMLEPFKRSGEWWIISGGMTLGQHAYSLVDCSDQRQAFRIRNTWPEFPDSWIAYRQMEALFWRGGEAAVIVDR